MKTKHNKELFFHLGLPKTASTFLQVVAFPQLEGIHYFRKRKFKNFVALAKNSKAKKLLFTTESDRGFDKKLEAVISDFPNAKIIIVFRRQDKWIASKYKYYIRKHGHLKFNDFFDLERDNGFWKKEELHFSKYIDLVEKFTSHPPLVLTFDELKSDHNRFVNKIVQYLNIPPLKKPLENKVINKAFSDKQIILLRRFNTLYKYKAIKTKSNFLNKVHYKYREFLLHIVAFFSSLVPTSFIKNEVLIPSEKLHEIKKFYEEDWKRIMGIAKGQGISDI